MNDDLRVQFSGIVHACGAMSALEHIAVLKREADATDKRRCGSCVHWMHRGDCPSEKSGGLSGYSKGPSSEGLPCGSFLLEPWVAALKAKRFKILAERVEQFKADYPEFTAKAPTP